MSTYFFNCNPSGAVLRRLMAAVRPLCCEVLLVVRDESELSANARVLLSRLEPARRSTAMTSKWPGTELFGHTAVVHIFNCTEPVLSEICGQDCGLYDWQSPDLPEDPCFLRSDGTGVLTTVSHEELAYLELTDDEHAHLLGVMPDLGQYVTPEDTSLKV